MSLILFQNEGSGLLLPLKSVTIQTQTESSDEGTSSAIGGARAIGAGHLGLFDFIALLLFPGLRRGLIHTTVHREPVFHTRKKEAQIFIRASKAGRAQQSHPAGDRSTMTARGRQRYINISDIVNTEEFCNTAFCIAKHKQMLVEFADFILTTEGWLFHFLVR